MKNILKTLLLGIIVLTSSVAVSAQVIDTYYYNGSNNGFYNPGFGNTYSQQNFDRAYYEQLLNNIFGFGPGFNNQQTFFPATTQFNQSGTPGFTYRDVRVNSANNNFNSNNNFDDRPDVRTESARDIEDDSAELRGEVDMNDARDGIVFFVYGQDEDMIRDVEDDYDEYRDVEDDEENDDFEVERVDSNFDGRDDFDEDVSGLEEDEEYFFVLCVEYENDDNDERLECGSVRDFDTDDDSDSNEDEPEVETISAINIDDDSARIRGDVDMNDFDDGRVFFVWGENEDEVEDVEDEDRYLDINEQGDDLQRESVETNFDGNDQFSLNIFSLDDDTDHYFRICVEYEDDDNDDTLECGDVEDFETDN